MKAASLETIRIVTPIEPLTRRDRVPGQENRCSLLGKKLLSIQ
jgi:hypothetical protein